MERGRLARWSAGILPPTCCESETLQPQRAGCPRSFLGLLHCGGVLEYDGIRQNPLMEWAGDCYHGDSTGSLTANRPRGRAL